MRLFLNEIEKIICAVIFLVMTILGFANVVVRYLSNSSFAATQEILLNGFLLITVFGAAIAARRGEHLCRHTIYRHAANAGSSPGDYAGYAAVSDPVDIVGLVLPWPGSASVREWRGIAWSPSSIVVLLDRPAGRLSADSCTAVAVVVRKPEHRR